ncbi:MAG: type IV secretion system protein [Sphingomonas sp.]|uniref:type IV secretion system protein n=1 Tax=Sphingomonas sp. TaxID=28214 RepID=UPI0025DDD326|nr:type IV secretion system protein [Sphingomonas sp.]MBX3564020.1 type IV secretion system protein [Sphingomonas sp.]
MSTACPGIIDGAFLESALGFIDCQAQSLGARGYDALAAPGSNFTLLLTGLLTLFIAFAGYRMLLGETFGVRAGVMAFVKIGIVLTLATSWAAYRPLVYDLAFHGPAELASAIGRPAGVPGAEGGMAPRLGQTDAAFIALGRLGTGPVNIAARPREADGQSTLVVEQAPEPMSIFGTTALGTSRLVFLTATIAAFASVRFIAGLLLAVGPFFIAFLLFQGSRGLFEGWIRALAAAAIGALAVTLMLGLELALLEPWLATLIARREAGLPIGGATTELLVVTFAFALVLLAALGMAARIVLSFRLPAGWREATAQIMAPPHPRMPIAAPEVRRIPAERHSRAAALAEAVSHIERRETMRLASDGAPSRTTASATMPGARDIPSSPLGQSHRRRAQTRVSASAGRRDATL